MHCWHEHYSVYDDSIDANLPELALGWNWLSANQLLHSRKYVAMLNLTSRTLHFLEMTSR
jgi:hypothetical protein